MNGEVNVEGAQNKFKLPRHVAIIMDGNGRWAVKRNKPRIQGHREATNAVTKVIETAAKRKIEILSLFAFSSENWGRPKEEVSYLLQLFLKVLRDQVGKLHENNICLRVIGDLTKFSKKLQQSIVDAESLTKNNTGLKLVVAANYGGRWDILQAAKKLVTDALENSIPTKDFNEELLSQYLSLSDLPDPELLIRTSGELRISNFFLWQLAYTELYFTDVLWPDFNEDVFDDALKAYSNRRRRFGAIDKQGGKSSV